MMESILQYLAAPLGTVVLTWLVSRRLSKAQAREKELENENKALDNDLKEIDVYKRIIEDLKAELLEGQETKKRMLEAMDFITAQNKELLQKVNQLEKDYESLNRNYNELRKEYKKLLINNQKQHG